MINVTLLSSIGLDLYVLNIEPLFGIIMKPREYKDMAHVLREFEFFKLQILGNENEVMKTR